MYCDRSPRRLARPRAGTLRSTRRTRVIFELFGAVRLATAALLALATIAPAGQASRLQPHAPRGASSRGAETARRASQSASAPGSLRPDRSDTARPAADRAILVGIRDDVPALVALGDARLEEPAKLKALDDAERPQGAPLAVGFTRTIERPRAVDLPASLLAKSGAVHKRARIDTTEAGDLVWTGKIRVEGAPLLRLYLSAVTLPDSALVFTYGADGIAQGPVTTVNCDSSGGLWCPTVVGDTVWVEVQVPRTAFGGESFSFAVERIGEIRDPEALFAKSPGQTDGDPPCNLDLSCVATDSVDALARAAFGRVLYESDGDFYVVSGGLLYDQVDSTPYFLTTSYAISSPGQADSVEVWWNYATSSCGGAPPSPSSLPKSQGAYLLTTVAASSASFLRLRNVPGGRYYMGWYTDDVGTSTDLRRISYTGGGPAQYSTSRSNNGSRRSCDGFPLSGYYYETPMSGAVDGGSYGAPAYRSTGSHAQAVGHFVTPCGTNLPDYCDYTNNDLVEGRFGVTYPAVAPWLDPLDFGGAGGCASSTTAVTVGSSAGGTLSFSDCPSSVRPASYHDKFTFAGSAATTYQIDMTSTAIDCYLALVDSHGNVLQINDDVVEGNFNSRIVFTPSVGDTFTLEATSYDGGETGSYTVSVATQGSCAASLAPTSQSFGPSGGNSTVAVTIGSGCAWSATSNASFLHVTGGANGSGNGTVSYTVDANGSSSERTGTITIAGATFTVVQSGEQAGSADLAVTNAAAPNPVAPGGALTFTVVVTNAGASAASNATLTLPVPASTTFRSASAAAGWAASTPSAGGTGTVTFTTASVGGGTSATFRVVVDVGGAIPTGTTIAATATVSSTGDANAANDSATASASVGSSPTSGVDIRGTYTGTGSITLSQCSDPFDNGSIGVGEVVTISSQNGGSFAGTIDVEGGSILVSLSGTVSPEGALSGTWSEQAVAGFFFPASGSFTGQRTATQIRFDLTGSVTSGETCAVTATFTAMGGTPLDVVTLSWDRPDFASGVARPAPRNLRLNDPSKSEGAGGADYPLQPSLLCYRVYATDSPNPNTSNSRRIGETDPNSQSSTIVKSRNARFYFVVACYPDGESEGSNPVSVGAQAASLTSLKFARTFAKVKIFGSNFSSPVTVRVDNLSFLAPSSIKTKRGRTFVKQGGQLSNGQTMGQYFATRRGRTVPITVQNSSGGIATYYHVVQ